MVSFHRGDHTSYIQEWQCQTGASPLTATLVASLPSYSRYLHRPASERAPTRRNVARFEIQLLHNSIQSDVEVNYPEKDNVIVIYYIIQCSDFGGRPFKNS
ncbi:hypothetical protein C8Q74DRAFT_879259 [Fomes fomentarius]|nr:hypothetical protein C8Q74DRAFT_879259 [Fomes fomentarius]